MGEAGVVGGWGGGGSLENPFFKRKERRVPKKSICREGFPKKAGAWTISRLDKKEEGGVFEAICLDSNTKF